MITVPTWAALTQHAFVNNSGNGDLASASNWNPTVGEGAWATDEFKPIPGVDYTMSSAVSFGHLLFETAGLMTFKNLTLETVLEGLSQSSWTMKGTGGTNVFDGVTMKTKDTIYSEASNALLVLTNGSTLVASDRLKFGWGGSDSAMIIAGSGTSVTATGGNLQFGNNGSRNTLRIADGATAKLATGGDFNLGRAGVGNAMEVTGAGTSVEAGKPLNIGSCNQANKVAGGNRLTVADHAYLKIPGKLAVGSYLSGTAVSHSPSNRVSATDGATLDIVDNLSVGNWSPQNQLTIDGAFCTNKTLVVGESASAASNRVHLVNGGVLVSKESVIIGANAPDNELVVSNDVEFANDLNKNVVIGQYETSTGNRVLIDSPAKVSIGQLYFGYNSSNNVMKVRNVGAPFSKKIWIGANDRCSSDNYFEWDDSFTATGEYPIQFGAGATNCVARLKGISWKKIGTSTDFCIHGARNAFEFVNGSMWTIAALIVSYGGRLTIDNSFWDHNGARETSSGTVTIGADGVSNVLEVVNGSSLIFTNGSTLAVASTYVPFTNTFNRIVVGDRSRIEIANYFRINRACNEFVISNGTFQFGTEFSFPALNSLTATIPMTNQVVRFYGAQPRMVVTGADMNFPHKESTDEAGNKLMLAGYDEFHFDIPSEGYAEPPMEATGAGKKVMIGRTHRFFVTGDILKTGGKVMLARGASGVEVSDLTTLSSALPAGCKLKLWDSDNDNAKELWLSVSRGMEIIFK